MWVMKAVTRSFVLKKSLIANKSLYSPMSFCYMHVFLNTCEPRTLFITCSIKYMETKKGVLTIPYPTHHSLEGLRWYGKTRHGSTVCMEYM